MGWRWSSGIAKLVDEGGQLCKGVSALGDASVPKNVILSIPGCQTAASHRQIINKFEFSIYAIFKFIASVFLCFEIKC